MTLISFAPFNRSPLDTVTLSTDELLTVDCTVRVSSTRAIESLIVSTVVTVVGVDVGDVSCFLISVSQEDESTDVTLTMILDEE